VTACWSGLNEVGSAASAMVSVLLWPAALVLEPALELAPELGVLDELEQAASIRAVAASAVIVVVLRAFRFMCLPGLS
jgi:hypothetical protein